MRRKSKRLLAASDQKPAKADDEATTSEKPDEAKRAKTSPIARQTSESSSTSQQTSKDSEVSTVNEESTSSSDVSSLIGPNPKSAGSSPAEDESYLYVELKLMSVDSKCANCDRLAQKYICINSSAQTSHVKKFIASRSNLTENLFEIVLMCNGYEIVNDNCPLIYLKDKFFKKQETIVLYYAIIERYFKKFNSIDSGVTSLSAKSFV